MEMRTHNNYTNASMYNFTNFTKESLMTLKRMKIILFLHMDAVN